MLWGRSIGTTRMPGVTTSSSSILVRVIGLLVLGFIAFLLPNLLGRNSGTTSNSQVQIKFSSPSNKTDNTNKNNKNNNNNNKQTSVPVATRSTYIPRGRLSVFSTTNQTIEARRQEIIQEWGSWTLVDDKRMQRPQQDFYQEYPHRDVPRSKFPAQSWQLDTDYLAKFLPESIQLVQRAQTAILAEYGHTNDHDNSSSLSSSEMFRIFRYNSSETVTDTGSRQGGWTTESSWQSLVKRILHAIMTEDSFVFAMGGHSAAAGHGNHFQQSYTLQIQWILEPIFARMGVQMIARNFGNGGLGTIHNAMAAGDIYGHDVDMFMWDSGMTENNNRPQELFHRQGLLASPYKIPILWTKSEKVAREYNLAANVDIGIPGNGNFGLVSSSTMEELLALPLPARYLKCAGSVKKICEHYRYDGTCWINRPDVEPSVPQGQAPGGRASWHPGKWEHQIFGRVLAYTILEATQDALLLWKNAPNLKLEDTAWHMTNHYTQLRKQVQEIPLEQYHCTNFVENDMEFMCRYPLKARTEFTPRAYPAFTSIRTLMPPEMLAQINDPLPNIYDPPDVFNPSLHPPEGDVDVLSIVEAGVPFPSILAPSYAQRVYAQPKFAKPPQVPVGKGIVLETKAGDEFCDGSLHSFCNRGEDNSCLLSAHNDGRNGFKFDSLSGWIVMNIPDLLHGYIIIKVETWHQSESVKKTEGWMGINNATTTTTTTETMPPTGRSLSEAGSLLTSRSNVTHHSSRRRNRTLKKKPPELCGSFMFEYAINGKVTTMDKGTFLQRKQDLARVVETIVLLNDTEFTGGVETEVEVAIRITGCDRINVFKMSHIYWA